MLFSQDNFSKVTKRVFSKTYLLEVIIRSINLQRKEFCVNGCDSDSDSDFVLYCRTNLSISKLKINDKIIIRCRIEPDSMSYGNTYANVLFYCITLTDTIKKYFVQYDLLESHITNLKSIMIKKAIPTIIKNIGIIIIDDNLLLTKFISLFQSKCTGNLFIYNISKKKIKSELINSLNYFQKYHEIDLVCILTGQLEPSQVLKLSAKKVIYIMFKMKPIPYVISVTKDNQTPMYLTSVATNKHFVGLASAIDFIYSQQFQYNRIINLAMSTGLNAWQKKIRVYEDKLQFLESYIMQIEPPVDYVQLLRENVIRCLDNQVKKLIDIELNILRQSLSASQVQSF